MSKTSLHSSKIIERIQQGFSLPVMEHFYTIQGEGFHSGVACYFVRLGGCDVGCPWCDVKESWEQEKHPIHTVEEILEWVVLSKALKVVVTRQLCLSHTFWNPIHLNIFVFFQATKLAIKWFGKAIFMFISFARRIR